MAPNDGQTDEEIQEKLKSALWYAIGQVVDHEAIEGNINATPQFIGALTEMVWNQIATASADLERFSRHANRKTINTDDVLLLCRRNEGLEALMTSYVDHILNEHNEDGTHRNSAPRRGAT